jgi:hypothetical protein
VARKRKSRAGRPSLGDAGLSRVVSIKVSEAIREQWVAAAARKGLTLGKWLREAADAAIRVG